MKLAALRYSPEIALASHPTLPLRPATKKSLAVFDVLADRNPIQVVTTTVMALNERIQGSTVRASIGCIFVCRKGEREQGVKGGLGLRAPTGQQPDFRIVLHVDQLAH